MKYEESEEGQRGIKKFFKKVLFTAESAESAEMTEEGSGHC
jgi:hypothetical protein